MGTASIPGKVKLISGLLASNEELLAKAKGLLRKEFGPIDLESEKISFSYTEYYNEEMGEDIIRQYISFEKLVTPDSIAAIKLKTNVLEQKFSVEGKRKVNIDPGYVDLSKMVLATTKDATYRIYLGDGIYAQTTLVFQDKSFRGWPWTYPDYKDTMAVEFFNKVRESYKENMRNYAGNKAV